MRESYKILLLLSFTLLLYFPSLKSGYFVMDDMSLVASTAQASSNALPNLIQHGAGKYYRPMMQLSYLLDAYLWDMKASFMHLLNILIHFANALMVYFIVRRLHSTHWEQDKNQLPFLSAILFAVHPINTESINWISGRTDPLATLFCLLAFYLFLCAWQKQTIILILLSAFMVFLGSLAKEVAFFMNPGFILTLLLLKPSATLFSQTSPRTSWRVTACVPYIASLTLYLYLRSAGFSRLDHGIAKITENSSAELPWQKIEIMITAFGFYLKKLIVPYPLTFAIDQIDPIYFWVGIALAILSLALLSLRKSAAVFLLFILLTIFPALLNACFEFAWTPYAERYLYLPAALFSICLAVPLSHSAVRMKLQYFLIIALFLAYLPISVQRNLLWGEPLEFVTFTHTQSPQHPATSNMYGIQIAEAENYTSARAEFNQILLAFPGNQTAYRNLAKMELYIDDPEMARQVLEPMYDGRMQPEEATLEVMININRVRLERSEGGEETRGVRAELISANQKLYELSMQPQQLLAAVEYAVKNEDIKTTEGLVANLLSNPKTTEEQRIQAKQLLESL